MRLGLRSPGKRGTGARTTGQSPPARSVGEDVRPVTPCVPSVWRTCTTADHVLPADGACRVAAGVDESL